MRNLHLHIQNRTEMMVRKHSLPRGYYEMTLKEMKRRFADVQHNISSNFRQKCTTIPNRRLESSLLKASTVRRILRNNFKRNRNDVLLTCKQQFSTKMHYIPNRCVECSLLGRSTVAAIQTNKFRKNNITLCGTKKQSSTNLH